MNQNANLYVHFIRRFPSDLSQPLLVTQLGRQVSYQEAIDKAERISATLLELGASKGDRVTVQVDKSPEALFLYLACLRAGLIYHPLNMAYTSSELAYFLANAEPSVIVCQPQKVTEISSLAPPRSSMYSGVKAILSLDTDGSGSLIDRVKSTAIAAKISECSGGDIAALLYSSGTTGRPKGIMLSHDNLRSNAQTLVALWGFTHNDILLHALPIYHVHGLFVAISCVLMSGAKMVWHSAFDDNQAINDLSKCTVMMGVPTFYTRLLANPNFTRESCTNMRLFISGSAPLLSDTFAQFEDRTGHRILERYGMSETGMNTSNPLVGQRRAGTVGLPLPGVQLRIVNEQQSLSEVGEPGNLQVKGPNVFDGYWRMPNKTAEDFTKDGFFNTGDKAQIDSDGYVSIVGRAKDMVISGGLNVYPKEVELIIDELDGVRESAVIGVPDADFGEAVVAIIVAAAAAPTAEALLSHCRQSLANFKVPKRFEFVAGLPRNAMGKVQKNALRQRFSKT